MATASLADFQATPAAPSITSVGTEQPQADFQKQVEQSPIAPSVVPAPAASGAANPWEFEPDGETPYQKLHRLEPAVLGTAKDPKGNPIAPDQQKQAEQDWLDAYEKDVTQNGPGARMERFVKNIGPNIGGAIKGAASSAADEVSSIASHPFESLKNIPQGIGTGIADVAEGTAQLGSGAVEQLAALHAADKASQSDNTGLPSDARIAAGIALARLKAHNAYESATTPDQPQPGFGAGRLAGGLAAGTALIPGAAGAGGDAGIAAAEKTAQAAGTIGSAGAKVVSAASNLIPGAGLVKRFASALSRSAGEDTISNAAAKARSYLEDAPELTSALQQRVQTAEDALHEVHLSNPSAADLVAPTKAVADARSALTNHNMGVALYKNILGAVDAAEAPGIGSKVLRTAGKLTGQAAVGATAGTAYQGVAGQAGDPTAAASGFVGGGALAPLADMFLNSTRSLQRAGSAYLRAQNSVASSLPRELPEDQGIIFPKQKATQQAVEELSGKTPETQPKSAPVTYLGTQENPAGPGIELYNLNEDIPDHPKGSTVSRQTLEAAGFDVPPKPEGSPLPTVVPGKPVVPEAIHVNFPKDSEAPDVTPTGRDVRKLAALSIPIEDVPVPKGTTVRSNRLPGQHNKINQIGTSSPKEFNAAEMEIPAERRPQNPEGYYTLAGAAQKVESTKINSIGYDPENRYLGVNFKDNKNPGGRYVIHENVPPEVHAQLMDEAQKAAAGDATASAGKFYNKNILGNPQYRYINVDTPLHDESGLPLPQVKAAADQINKHNMRVSSLNSSAERGYETPEEIARRIAAETAEHQTKLRGILTPP